MGDNTGRETMSRHETGGRRPGFAPRRRYLLAQATWHETVTDFMPEPWLVALEHDRIGMPVRPGHRPGANR